MVRRPSGYFGINASEAKLSKIKLVDKHIDRANRIILANPVFQAFRKQRALAPIRPFNETLLPSPPGTSLRRGIRSGVFTQVRRETGEE